MTRNVRVGDVIIGGGAGISIQSMLSVPSDDVKSNVEQAMSLQRVGCDIIRLAVPNMVAIETLKAVKSSIDCPIVADIHFDHRLAIASAKAGIDKIRINPGNIGGSDNVKAVVDACGERKIPIRIGVNNGSIETQLAEKFGNDRAGALVESALNHVKLLENERFNDIVISVKCSNVLLMIEAYKRLSQMVDYPLHLGVTEAGTLMQSVSKSALGIGSLLLDGIGDTIRVSLTGDVCDEVRAARYILRAAGKEVEGIELISCPTCGRTQIPLIEMATSIEERLSHIKKPLKVAVMGCVVNGPGEAKEADIGFAGGKDSAVLFMKGERIRTLKGNIVDDFIEEVEKIAGL